MENLYFSLACIYNDSKGKFPSFLENHMVLFFRKFFQALGNLVYLKRILCIFL